MGYLASLDVDYEDYYLEDKGTADLLKIGQNYNKNKGLRLHSLKKENIEDMIISMTENGKKLKNWLSTMKGKDIVIKKKSTKILAYEGEKIVGTFELNAEESKQFFDCNLEKFDFNIFNVEIKIHTPEDIAILKESLQELPEQVKNSKYAKAIIKAKEIVIIEGGY